MLLKAVLLTLVSVFSLQASAADVVKMSNSGICHTVKSPWYERTKNFTPYDSLSDCLAAGGRQPKSASSSSSKNYSSNSYSSSSSTGYDRDSFGGWADFDSDNIDQRGEILIERSLAQVTMNSGYTYVVRGRWYDKYTDNYYTRASDVDIEHVVPVYYLYQTGVTDSWSQQQKVAFYNDPENLLIVDDSTNQSKSWYPPSRWLPPNDSYHCEYVQHFIQVAVKYDVPESYLQKERQVEARECN